jgi:hypothetical protein
MQERQARELAISVVNCQFKFSSTGPESAGFKGHPQQWLEVRDMSLAFKEVTVKASCLTIAMLTFSGNKSRFELC